MLFRSWDGRDPQAVFSKDGLFDELKKALAERVLNAELEDHLQGEGRCQSKFSGCPVCVSLSA